METAKYWKTVSLCVLFIVLPCALFSSQGASKNSLRGYPTQLVEAIQLSLEPASVKATQASPWKQYSDPTTGKIFWYNAGTKVSQWETPEELAPPPVSTNFNEESSATAQDPSPAERASFTAMYSDPKTGMVVSSAAHPSPLWKQHTDAETGKVFWYNQETMESKWPWQFEERPATGVLINNNLGATGLQPSSSSSNEHASRVAAGVSKGYSHAEREEKGEAVVVSHAKRVDADTATHSVSHADRVGAEAAKVPVSHAERMEGTAAELESNNVPRYN